MESGLPFLAAALLLSAGFGTSALLLRDRAEVSWCELAATTLLLGTFVTTFGWWLAALVFPDRLARLVVGLGAIGLAAIAAVAWRRRAPRRSGALPLWLVLLPSTLLIGWLASTSRFGWDGLFIWELKADAIAVERGIPWHYLHDDSRAWSHPIYPLLVPMQRAWLLAWHGLPHQAAAKVSGVLFFTAAVGLLLGPGRRLGRTARGVSLAFLACTPLLVLGEGSATSGYADFPLAAYYLGAVLYLLPVAADGVAHDWPMAAWLAAALPWTKPEGRILWACWGALALVTLGWRRRGEAALALLPGAATALAWTAFTRLTRVESAVVFDPASLTLLRARLHLAPEIARAAAKIALAPQSWGFLWVLFLAAALLWPWWSAGAGARSGLLAAAVLLPLPFYCLPYLFSRWQPVTLHVESSFARLLLHLALPALAFVATATAAALSALRRVAPA